MKKLYLVGPWVVLLAAWAAFSGGGGLVRQILFWALLIATVLVLVTISASALDFMRERRAAIARGEPFLTEPVVMRLLIGGLVVGALCRGLSFGIDSSGVLGVISASLLSGSLLGLFVLGFLRERRRKTGASGGATAWKYGLIGVCAVSLLLVAIVQGSGVLASIVAGVFWISAVALAVWGLVWLGRRFWGSPAEGHRSQR